MNASDSPGEEGRYFENQLTWRFLYRAGEKVLNPVFLPVVLRAYSITGDQEADEQVAAECREANQVELERVRLEFDRINKASEENA